MKFKRICFLIAFVSLMLCACSEGVGKTKEISRVSVKSNLNDSSDRLSTHNLNIEDVDVASTEEATEIDTEKEIIKVENHYEYVESIESKEQVDGVEYEITEIEEIYEVPQGTYNYCPSVILGGELSMFYCSNTEPYTVRDSICYSNCNEDATLKNMSVVLSPTPGSWDSVHVCDPSVISGNFLYKGTNYKYLMAYLGCNSTDNQRNQIGFAVSNNLPYGWVKIDSNPIIQCNYNENYSSFQWGVGQPSLINLDGNGHVVLFYTEGTYNLTSTKVSELDLSNLDNPTILNTVVLSNDGTNDFISNGDFAISGNTLYMICDTHPFGSGMLDCVPSGSAVYSCIWDYSVESLSSVTWVKIADVNNSTSGYGRNHNCGLYRDVYGNLADTKCIYTSGEEKSDFASSLYTYRLRSFDW